MNVALESVSHFRIASHRDSIIPFLSPLFLTFPSLTTRAQLLALAICTPIGMALTLRLSARSVTSGRGFSE